MPERQPLTARQRVVFNAIVGFRSRNGFSPTVRDLMAALGIGNTNGVACHLRALRDKGFIKWEPMKARSIVLIEPGVCATCGREK